MNVLDDPTFLAGEVATDFIDKHPELLAGRKSQDRGTKALAFLADVTVNQPNGERIEGIDPRKKLPAFPGDKASEPERSPFDGPSDQAPPAGWRQRLLELGPEGFAKALRAADGGGRHRHHLPRRPPVAAGHPGAHPRPAGRGPGRTRTCCRSCSPWRSGAGRPTTCRCASWARTRGSAWRCCAPSCRTSRCRCCCAGATPWATPRTRPRSPTRS